MDTLRHAPGELAFPAVLSVLAARFQLGALAVPGARERSAA